MDFWLPAHNEREKKARVILHGIDIDLMLVIILSTKKNTLKCSNYCHFHGKLFKRL